MEDEKIEVNECCKIPFSVDRYKDEVYGDILNMDACHILLDTPQQYDSNVQHKGRNNVNRLENDGVKFTLL